MMSLTNTFAHLKKRLMNLLKGFQLIVFVTLTIIVFGYTTPYPPDKKVEIIATPKTAQIWVDGSLVGNGTFKLKIPFGARAEVIVTDVGYSQIDRIFDNTTAMTGSSIPKKSYFNLVKDPSLSSTMESEYVNRNIALSVKADRDKKDAWRIIYSTILNYFDVLEANDESSGYLRTSWVGSTFQAGGSGNTIRQRVIVKTVSSDPLSFSLKFISEQSGLYATSYSDDAMFSPYSRIPKKYDGFIEELMAKLKN